MSLAETAHLVTQLDLKDGLTPGLARAKGAVAGFNTSVNASMQRVGKGVGQVGAGMARVGAIAGTVVVAGLAGAAKAAIDYEDAFAGVRKTVNATPAELEKLRKGFLDMSSEIPISANEFARLGEIAGQLGIRTKDIQEFSRVTALMGVTTDLSADQAADAFGRIGTILGLRGKDYRELADSINSVGQAGGAGEAEITEITKRFAAEGKAAGLSKEQIVGLAGATASLGFAPERGGTALARVFGNLATNISTANAKGKALATELGVPIKDLQRTLDQGEGMRTFFNVLSTIRDMKPTEAARFLKSIGVTNVSDRTIFRSMAEQLPFVNEQLDIAAKRTNTIEAEAEKRFAGVKKQFELLRNNIVLAGIEIGDGFKDSLGRAAKRLSEWVRNNRGELKAMGQEIGRAIDGIDWGKVMGALKTVIGLLQQAWGIIKQIPPEILALGGGALALNKLSGGLLLEGGKNIVGGLVAAGTRGLASRLPGVGQFVAQPVFVTNWPMGGMGGGAGGVDAAGAGGGGLRGLLKTGLKLGAGIGIGLGAQMLGNEIGGSMGQATSALGTIAGAFVAGGPVLGALTAVTLAITETAGLLGKIDGAQASNREAAKNVGTNSPEAMENLRNQTRLLKETQGLDRELLRTFSSTELGDALKNTSDALLRTVNKDNQSSIVNQIVEASKMAKEYGWTEVARHLDANAERARQWVPKPETFASAVAKGAMTGVAAGIGKEDAKKERKTSREEMRGYHAVARALKRVEGMEERGNKRGEPHQRRIYELMKSAMMGDRINSGKVREAIKAMERERERAERSGNRTLARNLGRDITVMKNVLARKQDVGNTKLATIAAKDTTITIPVTTSVSIRDVERTTNTTARYGRIAV